MNRDTLQARTGRAWQVTAAVFCTGFGLCHLLNVFTAGDGLWYWYAVLFDRGQRLYADLHLNLQPFFIVMTRAALHVFGHSWLGFRVFPLLQVALYVAGLFGAAQFVGWSDRKRALLLLASFGVTLTIPYYRFDDFHVTTQILQVYSIWLLLLVHKSRDVRRSTWCALGLGVLAGISIANRLNDGAALFAATAVALPGLASQRRWRLLAVFAGAAAAAFSGVVELTGDRFSDWYRYTVVDAARIKGGSGHILLYPITLPVRVTLELAREPHKLLLVCYPLLLAACGAAMLWTIRRFRGPRRLVLLTVLGAIALVALEHYWKSVYQGVANLTLAKLGVPLLYLLFGLVVVRAGVAVFKRNAEWNRLPLLLAVPFFQLSLAAVTAGSGVVESTPALALTLFLLPLVTGRIRGVVQDGFLTLLAVLSFAAYSDKFLFPFHWHHFYADQMFQNRSWYEDPVYGPMYVDNVHLQFIQPVCAAIKQEPGTGLFSAPYPHANYFCNIAPWHGYVQTWYDTSSRDTIDLVVHELSTAPPTWVMYQRSVETLYAHELVYTGGQSLPHRALDQLVMSRVAAGQWTVKQQRCFGGADWLLLRTTPPRLGEPTGFPVLQTNTVNLCD